MYRILVGVAMWIVNRPKVTYFVKNILVSMFFVEKSTMP